MFLMSFPLNVHSKTHMNVHINDVNVHMNVHTNVISTFKELSYDCSFIHLDININCHKNI